MGQGWVRVQILTQLVDCNVRLLRGMIHGDAFHDSRLITKNVEQQSAVGGPWNVVNFEGYLYQGWNCIMCVRFNNDETVSTPPTVRGRVASLSPIASEPPP